jgi:hypothetical protein
MYTPVPEYIDQTNGEEITMACSSCQQIRINGIETHETGCPKAWMDTPKDCFQCGYEFYRTESRHQTICDDCQNVLAE